MTNNTTRIDADWDTYQDTNLTCQTRAKRGETEGQLSSQRRNLFQRELNGRNTSKDELAVSVPQ